MIDIKRISERYGYLPYMIERYLKIFDYDELFQYLDAVERGLPITIRVNTLKIPSDNLIQRLNSRGISLERIFWIPNAFKIIKTSFSISSTPEHLLGYFFIQRVASMIPPIELAPTTTDLILDMCAAPGAKTTHLCQLMKDMGVIIAVDKSYQRAKILIENLSRMGCLNTAVLNMDARKIGKLKIKFSKILLDAPCTGEGLVVIDKKRKKSRSMEDILKMQRIQKQLLEAAINVLDEGGLIVYSTCSIAPEENEFVINDILEKYPSVKVKGLSINSGSPGLTYYNGVNLNSDLKKARRFYPHTTSTIGFFVVKLVKEG